MRMIPTLLAVAACLALAVPASAADWGGCGPGCSDEASCTDCSAACSSSCSLCGCKAPSNAYCTVECGTKTVTRPCWKVECELFCLPKPRCCQDACGSCGDSGCGTCGEAGCGEAGCGQCDNGCASCCGEVPIEKQPKCGKVRVRKRLLRSQCQIEVPAYHCVVKYCCPSCAQEAGCCVPGESGGEPEEEAPAAPAPDAQAWGTAPLPPAL